MSTKIAHVVGAGLAGSEAAWQLAQRGINVKLYDMKPQKKSPAHKSDDLAELVCSNSLRSNKITNAVGLLKEEMRLFKSLIIEAADTTQVPAGGALAVDRDLFSRYITEKIKNHPNITYVSKEVIDLPDKNLIVATGPLTSDGLATKLSSYIGQKNLYFYDAAAPIITVESLDKSKIFSQSRYNRGDNDYLNCPLNREEYFNFVENLIAGETAKIHGFEENKVFESCMPIESMAKRGKMSLAFGPLKPVGLIDPRSDKIPFAVVQLRQENMEATLYNLVGFQTRLLFSEQKRIFRMIPGLEKANFVRYGVMHRNTFINGPNVLGKNFELIKKPSVFFAGQITGIEGYVESAASGILTAISLARTLKNKPVIDFPRSTALGALGFYVSTPKKDYQPMHINFGIIEGLPFEKGAKKLSKIQRYEAIAKRAINLCKDIILEIE